MTAVDALAPPARYVTEIPLDDLHAVDHNRAMRDLDGLAATIVKLGVCEPVLVRSTEGAGYEIIDGARRVAAARIAGLTTAPCLIHNDDTDDDVELTRIILNVQRDDPTELEEAAAYDRLVTHFKMTGEEVADAVGRSPSHISKRRSLLVLPDEAKAALNDHRINIQTALGITGLVRDQTRLDNIVDALPDVDAADAVLEGQRQDLERRLAEELRDQERARKRDAKLAELEAADETVVEYPKWGQWHATKYRVCRTGEDHEAVEVDDDAKVVYLTTQPIPDANRQVPKPDRKSDPGFVEQARRKKEAALKEATDARMVIVRNILDGDDPDLFPYALTSFVRGLLTDEELSYHVEALVGELLGLAAPVEVAALVEHGRDEESLIRLAAACAMAGPEGELRNAWTNRDPGAWAPDPDGLDQSGAIRRYLGFLESRGYEPTDEEAAALTDPAAAGDQDGK